MRKGEGEEGWGHGWKGTWGARVARGVEVCHHGGGRVETATVARVPHTIAGGGVALLERVLPERRAGRYHPTMRLLTRAPPPRFATETQP